MPHRSSHTPDQPHPRSGHAPRVTLCRQHQWHLVQRRRIHAGPRGPEYNLSTTGPTTFAVVCASKCDLFSAQGHLSTTDASLTLVAPNGTVFSGQMDSVQCNAITLAVAVQPRWSLARPSSPYGPLRDTPVSFASYLGTTTTSLLPVAVAVLAEGLVLVAGNGNATFGVAPVAVEPLAQTGGAATLMVIDPTRGAVVRVLRLGARVDSMRANAEGAIVVAGSFGVAVLDSYLVSRVRWNDSLAGVAPGPCGVCCAVLPASRDNPNCRVDIGADGVVGAYVVGGTTEALWRGSAHSWLSFDAAGRRLGSTTLASIAAGTDVAVDSASKQMFISYFYNSNTGQEPIVMPVLRALPYSLGSAPNFQAYGWDAHDLRRPGWPAYGKVADARAVSVSMGLDGQLYFVGWSDGGNTMFSQAAGSLNLTAPNVAGDGFTQTSNMNGAARVSYVARMRPDTGQPLLGQLQLTRLPSTKGNSYMTMATAAAADGTLFLAATAACCIANRNNLTVNGLPVSPYAGGDAALMVVQADFLARPLWAAFSGRGPAGSAGSVDVATRGALVALVAIAQGSMQTVRALPGSACAAGSACGYLVVLPHPMPH